MGLTRPKYSQIYDSDWKNSCRVVTSDNVTLIGGAPKVVDGITLNQYDRVLVRVQNTGSQNGIYYVSVVGTGNNGTWVRALDADTADKLTSGATVSISEGSLYVGKSYRLTTPDPIVLGTTGLTFADATGGGGGGTGITYTASTSAPSVPTVGDQWYYTTGDILYEYQNVGTGKFWVDITSPTITSGNVTVPGGDILSPFLLMGA